MSNYRSHGGPVAREGGIRPVGGGGGAGGGALSHPWQPYRSPWAGSGPDPNAVDRALRLRVRLALINGQPAGNYTDEMVCFAGSLDPAAPTYSVLYATIYFTLDDLLGIGSLSWTQEIAAGLTAPDSPAWGADGAPPPFVHVPFATAQVVNGAITALDPGYATYATLAGVVTDLSCERAVRQVEFRAGGVGGAYG